MTSQTEKCNDNAGKAGKPGVWTNSGFQPATTEKPQSQQPNKEK